MVAFTPPPSKPIYNGDPDDYNAQMVAFVMDWVGGTHYDEEAAFAAELASFAPTVNAALAGANYKGDYNPAILYAVGDGVSYGSSVFLKKTTAAAGTTPVDGVNWEEVITLGAATINAGVGLTGGGSLATNPTVSADIANQSEAEAGVSSSKLMTPVRVAQAIAALGGNGWNQIAQTTVGAPVATASADVPSNISAYAELLIFGEGLSHNNGSSTTLSLSFGGLLLVTSSIAAASNSSFWIHATRLGTADKWFLVGGVQVAAPSQTITLSTLANQRAEADSAAGNLDAGSVTIFGR